MNKIYYKNIFTILILIVSAPLSLLAQQPNTFPSSGNVGIGTSSPATKLEVNGDIKSQTTNYNYYNVIDFSQADPATWYPIVLNGSNQGGPVKFEIIRDNPHEDGNWYGTIHFMGIFNSYGWGSSNAQFEYKYEEQTTSHPGNLVCYVGQQFHGTHIFIYLRGGRHYYIKSNTQIANSQSTGSSYIVDQGNSDLQITLLPTTQINVHPPTSLPAGGTEGVSWNKVSKNTALAASGNVLIGRSDQTNPAYNLNVNGDVHAIKLVLSAGGTDVSPTGGGYFTIGSSDSANIGFDNNEIMARNNGATSPLYIQNDGGDLILHNNNAAGTKFAIKDNGNVLIGKISQQNTSYKLDVDGNIRANKVVVNTTGADYVFDPSYHLIGIDSLRYYIAKFHHLPGIPSAETMKKDGLDMGNAYIKLLEKIEELTRYVVKQNDLISQQQTEIDKMKNIHR